MKTLAAPWVAAASEARGAGASRFSTRIALHATLIRWTNTVRTAPSNTALRSRRYRERRKSGTRCIPLPVNEATLDQFVRWGFLRADAHHDPASIVQVFYKLRADPVESLAT
jgi:hypothetical protein